jgi:riboflavin kinase/FMN adenylyltransferase
VIVAVFNHHFGFNKEGDYRQLWQWRDKYSFEAEEIPEQEVQHETVSSTKIRLAIGDGYIQRANAYLDHYYIIIGKAEEVSQDKTLPVSLVKVLITEESKLLPAPGIYAVSVQSENSHSKGMAIINTTSDQGTEVLLNIFEIPSLRTEDKTMLLFHKKIHGAIDLSSFKATDKLLVAKDEISELIY